jgi:hypothetical protein
MFLRHTIRKKDGKEHRYFSVVETSGWPARTICKFLLHKSPKRNLMVAQMVFDALRQPLGVTGFTGITNEIDEFSPSCLGLFPSRRILPESDLLGPVLAQGLRMPQPCVGTAGPPAWRP